MAEKTKANIGFEKQIWDAACVLWGHIPAAEYRKVIIGLIFLRYISAAFEARYKELLVEGDGFENDPDAYTEDNIFFVPEEARWETISAAAHTPEIGKVIDDAMRAIESKNRKLKNVLPKNYASPDLDKKVLGDVVDIFTNDIDMSDTEASEDLLGRTYEYCIAQFAEKEGVGGGEFYTPSSIVKTLVAILKPFANCRVYDLKVKADVDSPVLTGTPVAPTPDNNALSTQIVNVAYVKQKIAELVNGSDASLDTLKELADALGNDPNFATSIMAAIGKKLDATAMAQAALADGKGNNIAEPMPPRRN